MIASNAMAAVVATGSVDLASRLEDVWPLITDTDRTNRIIGVNAVTFRPIEVDATKRTSARFVAETSASGFKLAYEEAPFEWSHGKRFSVVRTMRKGPLTKYALYWTLAKNGESGTRVTVRLELVPKHWLLRPIAWLNARRVVASLTHLASSIDAHVRDRAPSPYLKPVSASHTAALDAAVSALKSAGLDAELAQRIGAFVRDASDADVVRIRPYELAEKWGLDRRTVLRAFLRAVPAGLVELRWGLICPSCLTASQQVRALDEISSEGHCQLCDISFELDLDKAVEATFLPHPAVRPVTEQLFCIGGPARTPHVLVQATLADGEVKDLDAPASEGRYRIFARGGSSATLEVADDASAEADVTIAADAVRPAIVRVRPGATLHAKDAAGDSRHVKIERIAFADLAATAHHVSNIGEFRTLFSSDLLKRGTPLKVARVAVLFSDLTGSTALYSAVGDAAAFRLVDDHFDVLRGTIEDCDGVVVKTMGDAVLATFTDANQCARAATAALVRFEQFRASHENGELVGIKLGMHAGACYVVTANGSLDYFGQTVNIASRVQHLAESGQIVMASDLYEALPAADRDALRVREVFKARVKGVSEPLSLVRVALARELVRSEPPEGPMSIQRA
jgi:class 3 adenylate cyclase